MTVKGPHNPTEVDYNKEFDNITRNMLKAFLGPPNGCIEWLKEKQLWRQSPLIWSLHFESSKLDRAGIANFEIFCIRHNTLTHLLGLELLCNKAAGKP